MAQEKQEMVKLWDSIPGFDFNPEIDLPELNSYFLMGHTACRC
jgi:hypothetical protein